MPRGLCAVRSQVVVRYVRKALFCCHRRRESGAFEGLPALKPVFDRPYACTVRQLGPQGRNERKRAGNLFRKWLRRIGQSIPRSQFSPRGAAAAGKCPHAFSASHITWYRLAYESPPFAKKVASAVALFAPMGTNLAHSARVRTIKHRLERWKPLECPRRAAPTAAKECFGERTTKPVTKKKRSARLRALSNQLHAATAHAALIQGVLAPLKAAACNSLDW